MIRSLTVQAFTATFSIVYILGFILDKTPFKYYPLINTFSGSALGHDAGPAMNWFGWITQGLVAGLVVALISLAIPQKWADRVWPGVAWLAPALVILVMLPYEIHWFTDS